MLNKDKNVHRYAVREGEVNLLEREREEERLGYRNTSYTTILLPF